MVSGGRRLLVTAGVLLAMAFLTLPAPAQESGGQAAAPDIVRQFDALKAAAERLGLDGLLPNAQRPRSMPEMRAVLAESQRSLAAIGEGPQKERATRARYLVFASLSLPRGVLVRMLDEARARGDMEVLFRGVPEGETLSGFAGRLISTASTDPVPLAIDPVSFRDHDIDVVPSIVDRDTGAVLFGTFFVERFDHHAPGATVDRVYEIAEPDLIAVMQARAARIDWAAKRQGALERAWAARPKIRLAKATRVHRRRLDLSVVLSRDAVAPDGTVIATAGTRVDPVAHVPFTPTLIVFDGTDAEETAYAAEMAARAAEPVLLTTDLGEAAGLAGLRDLSLLLDAPVYALDRQLTDRFQLRATPSLVRAEQEGVEVIEGWLP